MNAKQHRRDHRTPLTRPTVASLRALAAEATALADRMEAAPGDGIGVTYIRVYDAWHVAEEAMRGYQNVA